MTRIERVRRTMSARFPVLPALFILALTAVPAGAADSGPRLVAVILVPGFRADYLTRHQAAFSGGGLLRFVKQGAWYPEARTGLAVPEDAPALATLATGQWPARHGIVADRWWDRKTRRIVTAADRRSRTPTLAARIRETGPTAASLVLAVAWRRDTAGRLVEFDRGQACWFDPEQAAFVVSGEDAPRVPRWLEGYHGRDPVGRLAGTSWVRLVDLWRYADCAEDDRPGEGGDGFRAVFPHRLPRDPSDLVRKLGHTPLADRLVFEVAVATVLTRTWGQDEVPDLIYVVPEALGSVGRRFGSRSHEVLDTLIRLDRQVSIFLSALDLRVGRGRWTAWLMGVNGMPMLPSESSRRGVVVHEPNGIGSVRKPLDPGGPSTGPTGSTAGRRESEDPAAAAAERNPDPANEPAGGNPPARAPEDPLHDRVVRVGSHWYLLPPASDVTAGASPPVDAVAARLATLDGIHAVVTRRHFADGCLPEAPLGRALRRGYHPDASGDLVVVLGPGARWPGTRGPQAPWPDADRVVCVLAGCGVRHGVFDRPVTLAAMAPTLERILSVGGRAAPGDRPLERALDLPGGQLGEKRP